MKSALRKALILILLSLPHLLQAQGNRIAVEEFPRLDTTWGSVEYRQVLISFYDASNHEITLPGLHDPYYTAFYKQLLNKENLSFFTDPNFTPEARFQLGSPLFDILPSMLVLLTDQALFNEAVVVEEFLMETMLRSTYLMKDMQKALPDSLKTEFQISIKTGRGIYQSTFGLLQVLSLQKDEDGVEFKNLLSLARWTTTNVPVLWEWIDDLDQQDCLAQIRKLSQTHSDPEMRDLMKELLLKLELPTK